MALETSILKIQKGLHQRLKEELSAVLGKAPKNLRKYYQEYLCSLPKKASPASLKEFRQSLQRKNIFICGDYHSFAPAQKNFFWLANQVANVKNNQVIILLEAFDTRSNLLIKKFLGGEISEKQFLIQTHFYDTWGFEWGSYKAIFDWARRNRLSIKGASRFNRNVSLENQDENFALEIKKAATENSGKSVLLFAGDLHVCASHIVAKMEKRLRSQTFLFHQNIDALFFKFASVVADGLLLRLSQSEYCLLSDPPWEKIKSELTHYQSPALNKKPNAFFSLPSLEEEVEEQVGVLCDAFSIARLGCDDLQISISKEQKTKLLHSISLNGQESKRVHFSLQALQPESLYLVSCYFFLVKLDKKFLSKPVLFNAWALALTHLIFFRKIPAPRALQKTAQAIKKRLSSRGADSIFLCIESFA